MAIKKHFVLSIVLSALYILTMNQGVEAAPAPTTQTSTTQIQALANIVVRAQAPAMWKISKGQHILWVITGSGFMQANEPWNDQPIKAILNHAHAFIKEIHIESTYIPWPWQRTPNDICTNPDRGTLATRLPGRLYSRWQVLWKQYGNPNVNVERLKPGCAATHLLNQFYKKNNITTTAVEEELLKIAREEKLDIISPSSDFENPLDFFAAYTKMRDSHHFACFKSTLKMTQSIDWVRQVNNAWKVGDLKLMSKLENVKWYIDFSNQCNLKQADIKRLGISDLLSRAKTKWLQTVRSALAQYHVTVAYVKYSRWNGPDGFEAALKSAGYHIKRY